MKTGICFSKYSYFMQLNLKNMRKILLLLACVYAFCIKAMMAQTMKDNDVPPEVSQQFKTEYSNARETQWEKEGDDYSVTFSVPNDPDVNIVYDENGKIKEKYMALPAKDVPQSIREYLSNQYAEQKVRNLWVKQLGNQRVYKVELLDNSAGLGTITGSANGTSSTPISNNRSDAKRVDTAATLLNTRTDSDEIILFFDNTGNNITLEEASAMDSLRTKELEVERIAERKSKESKPVAEAKSKGVKKENRKKKKKSSGLFH